MEASPILATPPSDAGYELLALLNEEGWAIAIVPGERGVQIKARRDPIDISMDCRSVAVGALELWHALRWL